jgi:hypothetical protein
MDKNKIIMIHIIYTYKDKVYQSHKKWTFLHAEEVLTRLGASYLEIGISTKTELEKINPILF